jgi:hypothetical protein
MAARRLLTLLACLPAAASAQGVRAPPPPRPPVVVPSAPVMIPHSMPVPPAVFPAPTRRVLPMPGRPGRFIICPGHRRCPRAR